MATPFRKKIEIIFSNKRKIQLDLPSVDSSRGLDSSVFGTPLVMASNTDQAIEILRDILAKNPRNVRPILQAKLTTGFGAPIAVMLAVNNVQIR